MPTANPTQPHCKWTGQRSRRRQTMGRRASGRHASVPGSWRARHRRPSVSLAKGVRVAPSSTPTHARASPGRSPLVDGWDEIPGARGCTPQSCAFRDHFTRLSAAGAAQVFGLSTQDTAYQAEAVARLNLPFPLFRRRLALPRALRLPTWRSPTRRCSSAWPWSSTTAASPRCFTRCSRRTGMPTMFWPGSRTTPR